MEMSLQIYRRMYERERTRGLVARVANVVAILLSIDGDWLLLSIRHLDTKIHVAGFYTYRTLIILCHAIDLAPRESTPQHRQQRRPWQLVHPRVFHINVASFRDILCRIHPAARKRAPQRKL